MSRTPPLARFLSIVAASLLAACSSGAGADGAASPVNVLAFGVPDVPSATYQVTDSNTVTVSTPQGVFNIDQVSDATLQATFADAPGGVRVTAVLTDFQASASNPMGAPTTADLGDLEGDLVFVLDARGRAQVESVPSVSGVAARLAVLDGWAHELFPRLPGRAVEAGDAWQDTVSWSAEGENSVTTTGVYSYVASGDTVVDGRELLRITVSGDAEAEQEGSQGGMQTTATLTISESGVVLWDVARGLLHRMETNREMTGTVAMSGVGTMNMEGSGPRSVRLLEGEPR